MEKIIHPESDPRVDPKRNNQGAPAGRVLIAGLVGLLAAVFLNSAALVTDAKRSFKQFRQPLVGAVNDGPHFRRRQEFAGEGFLRKFGVARFHFVHGASV